MTHVSRLATYATLAAASVAAAPLAAQHTAGHAAPAAAQPAAQATAGPEVGQMAPDFSITAVTKDGGAHTMSLASLRGQTVVLAFFPRVRTSGCTMQLEAYRDKYAELFRSGQNVTLLAISTDNSADQQGWAKEAGFPNMFGSDLGGKVGSLYGAYQSAQGYDARYLYVIAPDGRITYTAKPFRQMVETAYTDLGAAVARASGPR
jgi:thioredoxin-dependent peroxiredoxin